MLVDRIEPRDLPAEPPRLLLPALLLATADWDLVPAHLAPLSGSWEEIYLAGAIGQCPADHRAAVAARVWRLIAASHPTGRVPVATRIEWLTSRHRNLAPAVLAALADAELADTARAYGIHERGRDPHPLMSLPRRGRRAAIRGWFEGAAARGSNWLEAQELLPLLDGEDVELVLELLAVCDRNLAAELTAFVWRVVPERARVTAEAAIRDDLAAAEGWLYHAPRDQLLHLVGIVAARRPVPHWAPRWAYRRALDGGPAAEQLYRIARDRAR